MSRAWIALLLLALAVALSACGDDDEPESKEDAGRAEAPAGETDRAKPVPKEADEARGEAADERREERERKELEEDREFDRAFSQTPFERLVDRLPLRRPPLYVRQYITGDGHKVYAAVSRKRFCKASAAGRRRAVAAFFRTADRAFRSAGVEDLEVVVTPLSETIDELPALAIARSGEVALTSRGRDC